ncbi:galectin-4 isoform X2 [Cynoglossus semilaevis]|uniref:galectin-4 isoform X2 n=1 Tax=Cynoglossus semilaevis TaxID=244447 RepID=UPI000D625878|nr:galectin-4 isoform X2 [Cynoglossus semilaevis]
MTFVAPPGYQPVYSPTIPYLGPIYGGLREGSSIYLQGSVPDSITRFAVNLLCGQYESSDIALHFNPRFDGRDRVVFNTCQNGAWGSEDKVRSMPFRKGKGFEMVIMVTSQGYKITVNGKDFHTFEHRLPLQRVCGLQIVGDVHIQTINIIGGGTGGGMGGYPGDGMGGGYPAGPGDGMGGCYPGGDMGGGYPGSQLPGMGSQPVYNPSLPYSDMIPGGMSSKRTLIIRGMVPYGAKKISINFLASRSGDVVFHMNPRVQEGVVVRNSRIGGNWGTEEREMNFNPFTEGQYFDISVRCGNQRFKVFVNGQHMFDFSHRYRSFNEIDKLEVNGDVQISYIHI